jgi:hypothetical protein
MINKLTPAMFVLLISIAFSCVDKKNANERNEGLQNLQDFDYRLFKSTSLWELAQAAEEQDTWRIVRIVKSTRLDINYQEPTFGNTLLMLTIINHHYYSAKTLLDLNANQTLTIHTMDQLPSKAAGLSRSDVSNENQKLFSSFYHN